LIYHLSDESNGGSSLEMEKLLMYRNRLPARTERLRLPEPVLGALSPGHFLLCPASLFGLGSTAPYPWQQLIYRLALEEAQAEVRPSLLERDLLAAWN
jgi:hypothetical protein